ncbi:hypothetical protein TTHERM_000874749 (macronuclear) [Tetrahymena thermophila SB210]|uniref:Uncharacterized protein n=1 Tax=Tetrahymena thermophila (strain SB210) TaxID=312017 RepID=W7XFS3_TETTS|nr:hypothetical protein TTHERM_000874749 [Tetrahymena thermophila SB210]EWS76722.1 hypothetical protein TTHERM_000874749 [Tetrahymena thermophila SB210]|eukprot:XP_012650754.1 hypothetical protein TTHERM_000874749 [Tetrahymena thermophila SB210]
MNNVFDFFLNQVLLNIKIKPVICFLQPNLSIQANSLSSVNKFLGSKQLIKFQRQLNYFQPQITRKTLEFKSNYQQPSSFIKILQRNKKPKCQKFTVLTNQHQSIKLLQTHFLSQFFLKICYQVLYHFQRNRGQYFKQNLLKFYQQLISSNSIDKLINQLPLFQIKSFSSFSQNRKQVSYFSQYTQIQHMLARSKSLTMLRANTFFSICTN